MVLCAGSALLRVLSLRSLARAALLPNSRREARGTNIGKSCSPFDNLINPAACTDVRIDVQEKSLIASCGLLAFGSRTYYSYAHGSRMIAAEKSLRSN